MLPRTSNWTATPLRRIVGTIDKEAVVAPILLVVALGIIGGAALALGAIRLGKRLRGPGGADEFTRRPLSTDVINMASIKVAGLGGLCLVVLCAAIAIQIPHIGRTVLTGFLLGGALAELWIVRRRGAGPMPSSGARPGANTVLSIDTPFDSSLDESGVTRGLRRAVTA